MLNKFKAFLAHLGISLVIFVTVLLICLFAWYPGFYFTASNTQLPIYTMIFVDIGMGPLLTFVVYKWGKPGLWLDLSLIGLFQVIALAGGIWVLYSERPVLTVFHQGYFYCLNSAFATAANADMSKFPRVDGMVPDVFLPEAPTPEEKQHREDVLKKMPRNELPPPYPAFVFGDQFKLIEKDDVAKMLYDEFDISVSIRGTPKYQQRWDKFAEKHPDAITKYAFFPLICSAEEHVVAVDRDTGKVVDAVGIPIISATKKRFLVQQVAPSLSPVDPLKPIESSQPVETEVKPTETSQPVETEVKPTETSQPVETEVKPTETSQPVETEVKPTETPTPVETEVKPTESPQPVETEVKPTETSQSMDAPPTKP